MSLEIILIPLAIALITKAHSKTNEDNPNAPSHQVAVETRMKNLELLQNAMRNIGCTTSIQESDISASLNSLNFTFKKNSQGIWAATFEAGTTFEAAEQIIGQIDKAYGIEVQTEVLRKIKERAPQSGMTLESETINEDSSVTLVLAVNQA
jgi:high-affinity Fe2+/Pb2+ permease